MPRSGGIHDRVNILCSLGNKNDANAALSTSLCVFGFVPLILVLVGIAQPILPSAIVTVLVVTIVGLCMFHQKIILSEFVRKFHN
jgi:hypothetical protein